MHVAKLQNSLLLISNILLCIANNRIVRMVYLWSSTLVNGCHRISMRGFVSACTVENLNPILKTPFIHYTGNPEILLIH